MFKGAYHPNAFLSTKRNVRPGLVARTKIVLLLEKRSLSIRELAERAGLSYSSVRYHLRLLLSERIVSPKETKPRSWELTGIGQLRLMNLQKP